MIRNISIIIAYLLLLHLPSMAQLSINEVMASNTSTISDTAGEYDDWIEIYNAGSQEVNLGGYFISDDPTNLQKWNIPLTDPDLTNIPAGAYLILWLDKDPDQGANHVDFKLSAAGEDLLLVAQDGATILDQLSFSNQAADISYGRSPDGSSTFQLFSSPTPGASNVGSGGLTFPVDYCIQVDSDLSDAVERENGIVTVEGFGLRIGEDFSGQTTTGIRFPIALPAGAIINEAYITFKAAGADDSAMANWTVEAQLINHAPAFSATNNNISQRPTTSAVVNWAPVAWSVGGVNGVEEENTPNLATLIQEVIDLNGWEDGNSIVFIIKGSGMRNAFGGNAGSNNFGPTLCLEASIPYPANPIENIRINEIAAAGTPYVDEGDDKEDWIELYNANNFDVDLSGLYLTDDYGDLDKSKIPDGVVIPANSFLTFFADNDEEDGPLHTNFSLRSKGEEVALAMQLATGLVILDSISFDDAPFMASYGRVTDGADDWTLFGAPTPDASNNGADLYLKPPSFSLASGIYQAMQNTTISHELADVEIRYTRDGTEPDLSDLLYTSELPVFGTQNIRARAYKAGYAPSQSETGAYVLEDLPNIPIVYLTTDPANFFDDEIGIYVDGTNGIQAFCAPFPVNWAQDWERPVNLKMFLPDGTEAFDVEAGVKISGVCSRNNAMKSLAISLREKDYGNGELGYRIFDNRDHDNFLRFKLRNSGQDYVRLGFRDMINQGMVVGKIDVEYQSGRPVLLYLNGQFWGIHNIREKYTPEFFEDNYNVNPNKVDIVKSPKLPWEEIKEGSSAEFHEVFDFAASNSLADDTNYNQFAEQVDINAFLNYWITMLYLGNNDWPANNLTIWKERKEGSKWRYCIADTDGSTNNVLSNRSEPTFNTLDSVLTSAGVTSWPYHENSTLLLRKLVEREDFKNEFIQRTCSFMGLIFSEERAHYFTDSIQALFEPNVPAHLQKWGGAMGAMGGGDIELWKEWIDAYKLFFTERPGNYRQHLNEHFGLENTYQLTFNFDETTEGYVVVNSNEMEMPYNFSNLYFKNIPLKVKAIAKPGALFSHWLETGNTNAEIDFMANTDATLTPIFNCLNGMPGTACDDGEECTINDVIQEDCGCKGIIEDVNGDGVGNEEDCLVDVVEIASQRAVLNLFPNPAQKDMTIQLSNQNIETLVIYNSAGQQVLYTKDLNQREYQLTTGTMPQGIYFIRLQAGDNRTYFGSFSVIH